MSQWLTGIEEALKNSANYLPLELSAFFGALVEEIVAPIPSPFVMAAVGSAAFAQSKGFIALVWLSFVGAVGKTIGAWLVYYLVDKLENVVIEKFGRFLGVSHQEIASIGKHFTGGWKDGFILFSLRALPVIPSSLVSVACGIIKVNMRIYLIATLFGNILRNLVYIYLGYAGVSAYQSILSGLDSAESVMQLVIFIGLVGFVGWIYYKRRQRNKTQAG